jgi:hypothetical protein
MLFPSWLRFLARASLQATAARCPAHRRAALRRVRVNLEQFEDRTLPSSFTAATVPDLIADINAANQAGGSNTITLTAPATSPYILTAVDNTTDGATGLPAIAANDNLTIVGNCDTIARSTAAGTPAFRLLDVAVGASLTLQNLTLQGGLASGAGVSAEGGAIYNQGTLDLNAVTVQNNVAQGSNGAPRQAGQAAAGGGLYSSGALTLEGGSLVQSNQALGGQGGRAGKGQGGPAGSGFGGGLYVASGTVTLTSATLSGNTAQGGQGGQGGNSTSARFGPGPGGSGGNGLGGGLYVAGGVVTLTSSSLSANTAQGGQGGHGGARFGGGGSGGNGFGGGVFAGAGTVTLRNDTVTSNSARRGSGGSGTPTGSPGRGEGGGLYIDPAAAACLDTFTHAHVQNNTASTQDPNIHGPWKSC